MKKFTVILLTLLCSINVLSMPCGKVPFYCVLLKNVENAEADKNNYYLAEEVASCSQTYYEIGNALPLCKVYPYQNYFMFQACGRKYGYINTVGVVYYEGGDPVNPFNEADKRMYGAYYRTSKIFAREPAVAINFVNLLNTIKTTSCDLVTK